MKRRKFLQRSSLVSLSPFIPAFLPQIASGSQTEPDKRILVVLQLSGGNDGLNTVIPFADENYAKHRSVLKLDDSDIIKMDDSLGLHPSMKPMADLLENGQLAVVNGVGYPNPNRSHFESMDIWQTARLNKAERKGYGWLGRAVEDHPKLQRHRSATNAPDAVYVGDSEIPVALRGRRANSIAFASEEELRMFAKVETSATSKGSEDLAAYISRTVDSSYTAAKRFAESAPQKGSSQYPQTKLGKKLQLLSRMLKLGGSTRVFYASQGGYDTHSDQLGRHANLLQEFSGALAAFMKDMEAAQLADRVVVLAFSEFGRRVTENGSAGTDHGAAGPVFIAGSAVKAGLHGQYPSLTDLHDGDLRMTTDFRSIYRELLEVWMGGDPSRVLGRKQKLVGFL